VTVELFHCLTVCVEAFFCSKSAKKNIVQPLQHLNCLQLDDQKLNLYGIHKFKSSKTEIKTCKSSSPNFSLKVYILTPNYSTAYCDVSEMAYMVISSAFYFELGSDKVFMGAI
jgi:hypothetical protein